MLESEAVLPLITEKPKLLFPTAVPRIPMILSSADHEKKRKVAVKCLELEEMLESQGLSQSEIETKVASFRALLLRQVTTVNNNNAANNIENGNLKFEGEEKTELEKLIIGNPSKPESTSKKIEKKKKKKRKESKHRKRKKEKRRHYCSSPSYSDYEPENPHLKYKRNAGVEIGQQKDADNEEESRDRKARKRKKRKHGGRSESRSISKSSISRSRKHKTRSKERNRKIKKKPLSVTEGVKEEAETKNRSIVSEEYETDIKSSEETAEILVELEIMKENMINEKNMINDVSGSDISKKEKGRIIFSRIEDIPTRPDSPNYSENRNGCQNIPVNDKSECNKKENTSTKLKFEISIPQKKILLPPRTQSTFAELSNKLGPTVNFNSRKLGINHSIKNPLLEPRVMETNLKNKKQSIKLNKTNEMNVKGLVHIEADEIEEVVFLKSSKSRSKSRSRHNKRSKSRSSYYSRSRSRSYSNSSSSRSRSRSRSWSYSRSRSYSSFYSRSRSRSKSRSPSIQRRRGSPSFLDKRRITSARKRPIPYHRPTPSPTPSYSSSSSYDRSPSRSRGRERSRSKITKR